MNNLPMSIALRGAKVRQIISLIADIQGLDGQIEEARAQAALDPEQEQKLKAELSEQDDKLIEALCVVQVVTKGAVAVDHEQESDPEYQKLVDDLAAKCRCRPASMRPCDGLLAGGLCDDLNLEDDRDADDRPCHWEDHS
jgi:hypothetical protein